MPDISKIKLEPLGIIGAGPAGLITAHVLLQDGFSNVQVITRDASAGGVWARERVYPGLSTNNIHGEYRFSPLPMPPPENTANTGGRLSGHDLCSYMETFADKFLKGRIRFKTEVLNIHRREDGVWVVKVESRETFVQEELLFSRIVVCTGGCSSPKIPSTLAPHAAENARFRGPVVHANNAWSRIDDIISSSKHPDNNDSTVLVVGGGKSAQDISLYLTNRGCKVIVVYEKIDMFFASHKPLPSYLRRSRLSSILSPHIELRTALERFLHTTWIGSKIVHLIWNGMAQDSFKAYSIPKSSPLRLVDPIFWNIRQGDEGLVRPDSFHSLVNESEIAVVAPARAVGYGDDGHSVVLSNGEKVKASAVILATGYSSSWEGLFDQYTYEEIGLGQHPCRTRVADTWDYISLSNPPETSCSADSDQMTTSMYRGIVPATNILRRDFAVNGGIYAAGTAYTFEVSAHWISSYFLQDDMRLPSTTEEGLEVAERYAAWTKKRYPGMPKVNDTLSTALTLFCWPQTTDELMEDMHLASCRSGGNWLTWPFKVIDVGELASLGDERRALREKFTR